MMMQLENSCCLATSDQYQWIDRSEEGIDHQLELQPPNVFQFMFSR